MESVGIPCELPLPSTSLTLPAPSTSSHTGISLPDGTLTRCTGTEDGAREGSHDHDLADAVVFKAITNQSQTIPPSPKKPLSHVSIQDPAGTIPSAGFVLQHGWKNTEPRRTALCRDFIAVYSVPEGEYQESVVGIDHFHARFYIMMVLGILGSSRI